MTRKKVLLLALCMAFVVSIFAGCSNANNQSNDPANNANSNNGGNSGEQTEPIHLTFWGGVPEESGPKNVVDNWNAANPDIQVEYVRYVNDDAGNLKLDTALMTGQNVDLYVNYAKAALEKRVQAGNALNLSEFDDYDIDAKMGAAASGWKVDDTYFGMPTTYSISHFWLNVDMLDEAGLPIPSVDWTWEEMHEYADALKSDEVYGLVQHMAGFSDVLDNSLNQVGYTQEDGTSNLDSSVVSKWLSSSKEMMDDGRATVPLGEQITSNMPVDNMFLNGEAGMLNAGLWIFRKSNDMEQFPRDFKIAFAPIPRLTDDPAETKQLGGTGDVISINAKSEHTEAAWKFLKWYADEGIIPMAAGGRIPGSSAVNTDAAIEMLLAGNEDSYDLESIKNVIFGGLETYTKDIEQQVIDLRQEEYEKFFLDSQDLQGALDAMAKRHNSFMETNK